MIPMTIFDANCLYVLQCLALVFVAAIQRALPLLGHRAVPAVWPQHAKRLLQPRRKMR